MSMPCLFARGWYQHPNYPQPFEHDGFLRLLINFERELSGGSHRNRSHGPIFCPAFSCWPPLWDFLS